MRDTRSADVGPLFAGGHPVAPSARGGARGHAGGAGRAGLAAVRGWVPEAPCGRIRRTGEPARAPFAADTALDFRHGARLEAWLAGGDDVISLLRGGFGHFVDRGEAGRGEAGGVGGRRRGGSGGASARPGAPPRRRAGRSGGSRRSPRPRPAGRAAPDAGQHLRGAVGGGRRAAVRAATGGRRRGGGDGGRDGPAPSRAAMRPEGDGRRRSGGASARAGGPGDIAAIFACVGRGPGPVWQGRVGRERRGRGRLGRLRPAGGAVRDIADQAKATRRI